MILCHIKSKNLIKFSYRKNFDIIGDDTIGYYYWNLLFDKEHFDNRHDLTFMFFELGSRKYSHSQKIKGVPHSIIETTEYIRKLAESMLLFSKKFGGDARVDKNGNL